MLKKSCAMVYAFAAVCEAHASTLGEVHGPVGWLKLFIFISVPGVVILMLALPFLLVSKMKGQPAAIITGCILFCEALVGAASVLAVRFVYSL